MKHKCPICGTGTVDMDLPHSISIDKVSINREVAKQLREKGYSMRQIQKALGYKNVNSIAKFLKV